MDTNGPWKVRISRHCGHIECQSDDIYYDMCFRCWDGEEYFVQNMHTCEIYFDPERGTAYYGSRQSKLAYDKMEFLNSQET